MFQRDYIMRMIEQISQMAGTLIGLKQSKQPQQALLHIDELLRRLTGLTSRLLNGLSDSSLLDLLRQGPEGGAGKVVLVAKLLKEEGDFEQMLHGVPHGYSRYCKSLYLYLKATEEMDAADRELLRVDEDIAELLRLLHPYELPSAIRAELWPYYSATGRYADAENELFRLLDEGYGGNALLGAAISAYARLVGLDDEALQAGGLSLKEAQEALEQLQAMQTAVAEVSEPSSL